MPNWSDGEYCSCSLIRGNHQQGIPGCLSDTGQEERKKKARAVAEEALRALGEKGDLYCHHQAVHVRPGGYDRLAAFFLKFAEDLMRGDATVRDPKKTGADGDCG